jgi:hypothetical protein
MKHLRLFESFFGGDGMPKEITYKEYKDLKSVSPKHIPIPRYLFEEVVKIGGAEKYLPIREHGYIQMFGRNPNNKWLFVIRFEPEDDAPYYLIRFTTNNTIPERLQEEQGLIKFYVAENFEEVKNFCKENL